MIDRTSNGAWAPLKDVASARGRQHRFVECSPSTAVLALFPQQLLNGQ